MSDHLTKFGETTAVTFTAADAIAAGNVVEIAGPRTVKVAGAASAVAIGTAGHDAAAGEYVVVRLSRMVDTATAVETITAGDLLEAGPGGMVQKATTGRALGVAITSTSAGGPVEIAR